MAFSEDDLGPGPYLRPVQGLRQKLDDAIHRALPDGTCENEFTDALLFLLSIRLNRLTGGENGMTFSARCHVRSEHARFRPARGLWAAVGRGIDLYCAHFRGEVRHCETAWVNHRRRRPAHRH